MNIHRASALHYNPTDIICKILGQVANPYIFKYILDKHHKFICFSSKQNKHNLSS